MEHKYTNRLIDEKSPYLLQHAHNPGGLVSVGGTRRLRKQIGKTNQYF